MFECFSIFFQRERCKYHNIRTGSFSVVLTGVSLEPRILPNKCFQVETSQGVGGRGGEEKKKETRDEEETGDRKGMAAGTGLVRCLS